MRLSLRPPLARSLAALIGASLLLNAWWLAEPTAEGRSFSFSLLCGGAFGFLLQRSRFCFFCVTRDFIENRQSDGLLGLVVALIIGTLGYHALFGSFVPNPLNGRLPPDAHVGPLSWVLVLAASVFGMGMAISGSCVSAHLYRLGEGEVASLAALAGVVLGFILGFLSWNPLYLLAMQEAPVIWLPRHLGYGGSLLLQLVVLVALAAWLLRYRQAASIAQPQNHSLLTLLFQQRWPSWLGGILIGALACFAYLRVAPLGVTAELGSLARTGAEHLNWLPSRLQGLDSFAGCATAIKETLLSNNGLFVLGLIAAAWASALAAGDFHPQWPQPRALIRNFIGGVLLGWSSLLALGCTIGTLLSGIMAGALSGWVFALFCLLGTVLGLKLRPWLRLG